jgi:mRNA-degrading endonuclease toxin of MazEF toxin-antitoxin module
VLVVQVDLLNAAGHSSTVVLPWTTRLTGENLLRVVLPRGIAGNRAECEVMIDQVPGACDRQSSATQDPRTGPRLVLDEVREKLRRLLDL